MNETTKPFIWAHENNANIQEPLDALKQQGWRYGDVPAASNFNWLFKKISDEFVDVKKELLAYKAENEKNQMLIAELKDELSLLGSSLNKVDEKIQAANNELSSHKTEIELNKSEIETAKTTHDSLKTKTNERFRRTFTNDKINADASRQICMLLRVMETALQQYHPNFPRQPWPMQDYTPPVTTAENEEEFE